MVVVVLYSRLTKAYEDHQNLSKEMQNKKRKAPDDINSDAAKKQKIEQVPATAALASAPAATTAAAPPATAYTQQAATSNNAAYSEAAYNAYYQVSRSFSLVIGLSQCYRECFASISLISCESSVWQVLLVFCLNTTSCDDVLLLGC